MKKILIVSATTKDNIEDTILHRSLQYLDQSKIQFEIFKNGKYNDSLAYIYNSYIREDLIKDFDIVLFCHDDLSIEDSQLQEKLYEAIGPERSYSVCGLAGSTECVVHKNQYNLWHIMNSKQPFHGASGMVGHYTKDNETRCFMSSFGESPKRVILLDGVFLAINIKDVVEKGCEFDEKCPSKFHFYDILFCLDANLRGLKMATWPIWCVHKSHGLSDVSKEFKAGNEYLIKKWG